MKLILNIALFLIAYSLILPLTFINVVYVVIKGGNVSGYFRDTAVEIDIFGNRNFRSLLNATLTKGSKPYKYGARGETISSASGKNKLQNTQSRLGRLLCWGLGIIDRNHCIKSINR